MGTRAFNAPAAFSPNLTVTGSVTGNKHPSNRSFLQLSPPNKLEYGGAQQGGRNVSSRPPRDAQSQRSVQRGFARYLTLEQARFLPREELDYERRRLNHPDAAATMTYKHATDKLVQDGAQEQDSGARVIIIKVRIQDGSRPRRYGDLE